MSSAVVISTEPAAHLFGREAPQSCSAVFASPTKTVPPVSAIVQCVLCRHSSSSAAYPAEPHRNKLQSCRKSFFKCITQGYFVPAAVHLYGTGPTRTAPEGLVSLDSHSSPAGGTGAGCVRNCTYELLRPAKRTAGRSNKRWKRFLNRVVTFGSIPAHRFAVVWFDHLGQSFARFAES